jgi:hypothetical protein
MLNLKEKGLRKQGLYEPTFKKAVQTIQESQGQIEVFA